MRISFFRRSVVMKRSEWSSFLTLHSWSRAVWFHFEKKCGRSFRMRRGNRPYTDLLAPDKPRKKRRSAPDGVTSISAA